MTRIAESHVWEVDVPGLREGTFALQVSSEDTQGQVAADEIRLILGQRTQERFEERDRGNAPAAWPEHWLLGTQPGPNQNGKKW